MNKMKENKKRRTLLTLTFGFFGLLSLAQAMNVRTMKDWNSRSPPTQPLSRASLWTSRPTSSAEAEQQQRPTRAEPVSDAERQQKREQRLARFNGANVSEQRGAFESVPTQSSTLASGSASTSAVEQQQRREQMLARFNGANASRQGGTFESTATQTSTLASASTPTSAVEQQRMSEEKRQKLLAGLSGGNANAVVNTQREMEVMTDALEQIRTATIRELTQIEGELLELETHEQSQLEETSKREDVLRAKQHRLREQLKETAEALQMQQKTVTFVCDPEQFWAARVPELEAELDKRTKRQQVLDALAKRST